MKRSLVVLAVLVAAVAMGTPPAAAADGCAMLNPVGHVWAEHETGRSGGDLSHTCTYEAQLQGSIYAVGGSWLVEVHVSCDVLPPEDPDHDPECLGEVGQPGLKLDRVYQGGPAPEVHQDVISPGERVFAYTYSPGTVLVVGNPQCC